MLKIRQGYTLEDNGDCTWIYPDGGNYLNALVFIVNSWTGAWIGAYPFGHSPGKRFVNAREAHAYLIASGSDSPWEESC